jgi:nitrate reductase gamma subunit
MTTLVYVAMAAGAVVFAVATIARALAYASHPIHLRWEIYPVPRGRRGELAAMIPEILFLKGLWDSNRALWFRSFPFHFGLYLLAGAGAGLLTMACVARLAGVALLGGAAAQAAAWIVAVTGWSGLVLAIAGALGLLHRRLTDPALRAYTTAGDVFNLLFFTAALGTLGAGYLARPDGAPGALSVVLGLLSWDSSAAVPAVLAPGLVMTAALVAYIPLTHMSHFVGKYFAYHSVRWGDEPNLKGGPQEAGIMANLMQKVTWAAPHIQSGGEKNWVEVATMDYKKYGGGEKK